MSSASPSGRLTLSWVGKDWSLLGTPDGGYEWVDRDDPRVTEVRLLHERETVGDPGPSATDAADNLLVVRDSYDALHALTSTPEYAEKFLGQVKLVYIDPPFNTGQAFAQYDDALEHSIWLVAPARTADQAAPRWMQRRGASSAATTCSLSGGAVAAD